MIQFDEFDGFDPKTGPHCIACETMLTDAVDGTLGGVDRTWFERHISSCLPCAEKLADAQRGSAWLKLLKTPRPEPGPEMLARILAETSGSGETGSEDFATVEYPVFEGTSPFLVPMPMAAPVPMPVMGDLPSNLIAFQPAVRLGTAQHRTALQAFGRILLEPRLAMTAAMAFFSIALTMNLTGVRLDQMHARDLKPENLRRDYYQASTRAVQYYDNLRVVHVMESRVENLKQATQDSEQQPRPVRPSGPDMPENPRKPTPREGRPAEPGREGKPEGTSRRESPREPKPQPQVLLAHGSAWTEKTGGRA